MEVQKKIKMELSKYLKLKSYGSDLTDDQKRLRNEFSDDRLTLGFHIRDKTFQVWYMAPSCPYCIFSTTGPFNVCEVISQIREQQKSKYELKKWYEKYQETLEHDKMTRIRDISRECGMVARKIAKGRVTSAVIRK